MSDEDFQAGLQAIQRYVNAVNSSPIRTRPEWAGAQESHAFLASSMSLLQTLTPDVGAAIDAHWLQLAQQTATHAEQALAKFAAQLSRPRPRPDPAAPQVVQFAQAAVLAAQRLASAVEVVVLKVGHHQDLSGFTAQLNDRFQQETAKHLQELAAIRDQCTTERNDLSRMREHAAALITTTEGQLEQARLTAETAATSLQAKTKALTASADAQAIQAQAAANAAITAATSSVNNALELATADIAKAKGDAEHAMGLLRTSLRTEVDAMRTSTEQSLQAQRQNTQTEFATLVDELRVQIATLNEEASSTVKKAREALAESGIGTHARIFKAAAESHERVAGRWLLGAAAMTAATIAWLVLAPAWLHSNHSGAQDYAVYFVGNTILLGMAIYCGRVYRAERHNKVVNEHRQNALTTYQAIIDHAGDDQSIRSAIVLQATQTIFAPQPTGHWDSKAQAQGDQVPLPVVALLSEAAKLAKGSH